MPAYSKTSWVNGSSPAINATNLNKIEDGIFATITQDGSTSMSGQFVTIAGTAGTPSIAPTGDGNTGIFFATGDEISIATGGFSRAKLNNTSMIIGSASAINSSFTFLSEEKISTTRYALGGYLALANTTATAAMRLLKYDNTNSTAQVYIQFTYDQGNFGGGQINGNGANAAAFGTFSDARLKENIENLPNQLENINDLRPVEFDYIDGSGHQIGFVAQEMQLIYPDAVGIGGDDFLTVTGWGKTEAILVKAIQELTQKVESLESRLSTLEGGQ